MQLHNQVVRSLHCFTGVMHTTADNRVRELLSGQTGLIDNGLLYRGPRLRYVLLLVRYKRNHQQTDGHGCDQLFHVMAVLLNCRVPD